MRFEIREWYTEGLCFCGLWSLQGHEPRCIQARVAIKKAGEEMT